MGFYDNLGGGFSNRTTDLCIDSDGRITVVGFFQSLNGIDREFLVKLNSNGTVYSVFEDGSGEGAASSIYAVDVQSDKKIIASINNWDGTNLGDIGRINVDGSLDSNFNSNIGTGFNSIVTKILVQSDGKILVSGGFESFNGSARYGICRLNSDGSLDTTITFGSGFQYPFGNSRGPHELAVQSDGKILCALWDSPSYQDTSTTRLVRIKTDGSLDATFESNQGTWESFIEDYPRLASVKIDSNGNVYAGGYMPGKIGTTNVDGLAKFDSNGNLDTGFCANVYALGLYEVHEVAIDNNGKILLGARTSSFFPNQNGSLIRLNTDGTLDSGFMSNMGTGTLSYIDSIKVQSDGKILVGGHINEHDGKVRRNLIRLNSDGTEDADDQTNSNGFYFNGRLMTNANINTTNIVPFEDISYINDAYVPDTIAPGVPTSLSASNLCQNTITLSWTAPSDNDISYYKIYRDTLNITKELYATTDDNSTIIDLVGNPGDKNIWTVSAVDNAGNEGSESSVLNQEQPPTVTLVTMSATGQSTSSGACSQTRDTDRYLTGGTITPSNGDKIYTNACATTLFDGADKWYSQNGLFDTWVYQISSTGVISNLTTC